MSEQNQSDIKFKRVKWAGPNTPFLETSRGQRIHMTKRDLLDLKHMVVDFVEFYSDSFTDQTIDNYDVTEEDTYNHGKYIEP